MKKVSKSTKIFWETVGALAAKKVQPTPPPIEIEPLDIPEVAEDEPFIIVGLSEWRG